MVELLVVCVRV